MKKMKQKFQKIKITLSNLIKTIKLRRLILIIILLIGNTYAWFIYSADVRTSVDVQVRKWKILFESENTPVEDYFDVVVGDVYPGMEDFSTDLQVYNKSDVRAELSYKVLSARIFDTSYYTVEGRNDASEVVTGDEITCEQLERILTEDYPFLISVDMSDQYMDIIDGEATYYVNVVWPFESGDDEADTYWGNKAYEYLENNPGSTSIELHIKIYITQAKEETEDI